MQNVSGFQIQKEVMLFSGIG